MIDTSTHKPADQAHNPIFEPHTIAALIHQRACVRPQLSIDGIPPAAAQRLTRLEYIFGE
jgi:hypothetical protein